MSAPRRARAGPSGPSSARRRSPFSRWTARPPLAPGDAKAGAERRLFVGRSALVHLNRHLLQIHGEAGALEDSDQLLRARRPREPVLDGEDEPLDQVRERLL